jgi:hypothetical protein
MASTRELSPTLALVTGIPDLCLWPAKRRHRASSEIAGLDRYPITPHRILGRVSPPSIASNCSCGALTSGTVGMPRDARMTMFWHTSLDFMLRYLPNLPHSFRPSRPVLRPLNLRFQFFKSVECNGADTNAVKDPVESQDKVGFFKVRI